MLQGTRAMGDHPGNPSTLDYASPRPVSPCHRLAVASLTCALGSLGVLAAFFATVLGFGPSWFSVSLVGLFIGANLAAAALGFHAARRAGKEFPRTRNLATSGRNIGIVLLCLPLLGLCLIFPDGRSTGTPRADAVKCASNLYQIGMGIAVYASDYGGAYPEHLGQLVEFAGVGPSVFVCPACDGTPATGATTQQIAQNLTAGGRLSYVYLGRGLRADKVPANMVIAYEPLTNHIKSERINVLFGDGHVEWFKGPAARRLLDQVNAGINPPKP